jgi:hypothetical protein
VHYCLYAALECLPQQPPVRSFAHFSVGFAVVSVCVLCPSHKLVTNTSRMLYDRIAGLLKDKPAVDRPGRAVVLLTSLVGQTLTHARCVAVRRYVHSGQAYRNSK